MTRFFLKMQCRDLPGSMERVLGVVRFRGFQLLEMTAHAVRETQSLELTLRIEGLRGEQLLRQLQKQADVRLAELFTCPTVSQPAPADVWQQPAVSA
jgi:acetolactate synthase regulatory subunit